VSRRASQRGDRVPAATPPAPGASPAAAAEAKAPRRLLAAGVALAVLIAAVVAFVSWPTATPVPPLSASTAPPAGGSGTIAASHVGAETCKTCHESEFQAWSGSHHQLAMQEATAASVLGDFANSQIHQGRRRVHLLQARRQVHGAHRWPGRQADRLRNPLHLRRLSAAAVPDSVPRRALPDAADRLGFAAEGQGRPALVPPLSKAERSTIATPCTGPASTTTGRCSVPSAIRPICARATIRPARPITPPGARSTSPAKPVTARHPPMSSGPGRRGRPITRRTTRGCRR
jgi:hypothetical protein